MNTLCKKNFGQDEDEKNRHLVQGAQDVALLLLAHDAFLNGIKNGNY
jgi:hypothetical protein